MNIVSCSVELKEIVIEKWNRENVQNWKYQVYTYETGNGNNCH